MNSSTKFVIQKHTTADHVHWDLMLELGDALQTYSLELPPEKLGNRPSTAVKIFDHPFKFLTYEGSVNQGKGSVQIADDGTYQILSDTADMRCLLLNGKILKGRLTLTHEDADKWSCSFS